MSVIFPKPLDTCYEELRRMYPVFMLKFKEIDALLKTEGKQLDEIDAAISKIVDNQHIATADSNALTELEKLLLGYTNETLEMNERRTVLTALIIGDAKCSASTLERYIMKVFGASAEIRLRQAGGDKYLECKIDMDQNARLAKLLDVRQIISDKLPAHLSLQLLYVSSVTYDLYTGIKPLYSHHKTEVSISGME